MLQARTWIHTKNQWVEGWGEMEYSDGFKVTLPKRLTNHERRNGHFPLVMPGRHCLHWVPRVNIDRSETHQYHGPMTDTFPWERRNVTSVTVLPKMHILSRVSRRHQVNPIGEHSTKPWAVFLKSVKVTKSKERVRSYPRLEETKETWKLYARWNPGRGPGLEERRSQENW